MGPNLVQLGILIKRGGLDTGTLRENLKRRGRCWTSACLGGGLGLKLSSQPARKWTLPFLASRTTKWYISAINGSQFVVCFYGDPSKLIYGKPPRCSWKMYVMEKTVQGFQFFAPI